jgi:hypothetical protein
MIHCVNCSLRRCKRAAITAAEEITHDVTLLVELGRDDWDAGRGRLRGVGLGPGDVRDRRRGARRGDGADDCGRGRPRRMRRRHLQRHRDLRHLHARLRPMPGMLARPFVLGRGRHPRHPHAASRPRPRDHRASRRRRGRRAHGAIGPPRPGRLPGRAAPDAHRERDGEQRRRIDLLHRLRHRRRQRRGRAHGEDRRLG